MPAERVIVLDMQVEIVERELKLMEKWKEVLLKEGSGKRKRAIVEKEVHWDGYK